MLRFRNMAVERSYMV